MPAKFRLLPHGVLSDQAPGNPAKAHTRLFGDPLGGRKDTGLYALLERRHGQLYQV